MDETPQRDQSGPLILPRQTGDRILLAVIATPVAAISALGLVGLLGIPETTTLSSKAFRWLLTGVTLLSFTASLLSLAWAVFRPPCIVHVLRRTFFALAVVVFVICLGMFLWGAWVLIRYG